MHQQCTCLLSVFLVLSNSKYFCFEWPKFKNEALVFRIAIFQLSYRFLSDNTHEVFIRIVPWSSILKETTRIIIRIIKIIYGKKAPASVHKRYSQSGLYMLSCLLRWKKTPNEVDRLHSHNVRSPGVGSSCNRYAYLHSI